MRLAVVAMVLATGCSARTKPDPVAEAISSGYLKQVQVTDLRVWRYSPDSDRWVEQSQEVARKVLFGDPPQIPGMESPMTALLWPGAEVGLYWVSCTEDGASRGGFVSKGPVRCNDVDLGEAPAGKVPACVPFKDSAKAQFVLDPKIYCR